jgi:hypothetical protein
VAHDARRQALPFIVDDRHLDALDGCADGTCDILVRGGEP